MKKEILQGAFACLMSLPILAWAIQAYRLEPPERIVIDGALDERAWARAPLLDRFWEIGPDSNIEAKVRTEARFAYDQRALYVAVKVFDPHLSPLRAP